MGTAPEQPNNDTLPERLEVLLSALIARAKNRTHDDAAKAQQLRKALAVTEGKIERLYGVLAEGMVKDSDLFRKSLSASKSNETKP